MRVLVTGATGLIGSAVVARLLADGHDVAGAARQVTRARRRLPQIRWIALDMARAASGEVWLPHLTGLDAVVNCAGALQDSPRDSVAGVHHQGFEALIGACEGSGVRRMVQISAIGIDRQTPTAFSATKRAGDEALMRSGLAGILIGLAIAVRRTSRAGLYAALAITAFYIVAGTVLLPPLRLDPLGVPLKALPIMVLHLIALAIIEDR